MNLKLLFVGLFTGSLLGLGACGDGNRTAENNSDKSSGSLNSDGEAKIGDVGKDCFYWNNRIVERDKKYRAAWNAYTQTNSEENCNALKSAIDGYIEGVEFLQKCSNVSEEDLSIYAMEVPQLKDDRKSLECNK